MVDDPSPIDPQEDLKNRDHLPGSGEINPANITHHDPLTIDIDDDSEIADEPVNPSPGTLS